MIFFAGYGKRKAPMFLIRLKKEIGPPSFNRRESPGVSRSHSAGNVSPHQLSILQVEFERTDGGIVVLTLMP